MEIIVEAKAHTVKEAGTTTGTLYVNAKLSIDVWSMKPGREKEVGELMADIKHGLELVAAIRHALSPRM